MGEEYDQFDKIGDYQELLKAVANDTSTEARLWEIRALEKLGRLDQALEVLNMTAQILEHSTDELLKAKFQKSSGNVYGKLGQSDKALECFLASYAIFEKLGYLEDTATCLNNIGVMYNNKGNLDQSLKFHLESLNLRRELGNESHTASSLNNIAIGFAQKGEFLKALEYFQESLQIKERIGNTDSIATAHANLGSIYITMGEIDKSLQHNYKALEIRRGIGNNARTASSLNNIGVIYRLKQDFVTSVKYLTEALELTKQMGNPQEIGSRLAQLIRVYLQMEDVEKAQEYNEELEQLQETNGDKRLKLYKKFSKALILKHSTRMANRAQAQAIFLKLLKEIDFDANYRLEIYPQLIDILLAEFQMTKETEVFDELKELLNEYHQSASDSMLYPHIIRVLIIKANIAAMEGDFHKTETLIAQAIITSQEKQLLQLEKEARDAEDKIIREVNHMRQVVDQYTTISERMDLADLINYLKNIANSA